MKIIKIVMSVIALLFIASCDFEPVDPTVEPNAPPPTAPINEGLNVIGKYNLIEYNTPVPTDLDNDNMKSANQMDETTCFSQSYIIIYAGFTFDQKNDVVSIVNDGTEDVLDCKYGSTFAGTWTLNNNILTLVSSKGTIKYNVVGNVLKTINNEEFTDVSGGNIPFYQNGNVERVYIK